MTSRRLPPKEELTICFAHAAYRMQERFALRNTGIKCFEVRTLDELKSRIGEADVLSVSGFWRNEFVERAPRLAFIQSISAGTDQYSREILGQAGVRVASAQGVNERAVAEHAIALVLAIGLAGSGSVKAVKPRPSVPPWRNICRLPRVLCGIAPSLQ